MSRTVADARPVLGIICCRRELGPEPRQAVAERYIEAAVVHADAAALLAPALPGLIRARDLAPRLDGLLLTGSVSNVEPARYGQAAAPDAAGPYDPGRDAMTADLVEAMLALGKPVFGICRGLQELNVVFGGALRRDMGRSPDLLAHHAPEDCDLDALFAHEHEVALTPGGLLARALDREHIRVNSVHFQGIARLAPGLTVEAVAPDGVIEAVSAEVGGAPVLAVQWHPEWRTAENPQSQAFFQMLGRALRGQPVAPESRT